VAHLYHREVRSAQFCILSETNADENDKIDLFMLAQEQLICLCEVCSRRVCLVGLMAF
jgi:hypothetical protein